MLKLLTLFCFATSIGIAKEPDRIGFVLSTLQEERYQKDVKFFTEEAKRLGLEVIVASADNNPQTQTAKVENLLSQRIKVLVIQPVNASTAANLVKVAHQDNVPVIAYDRLISGAPVDFYVTQDSFRVGVLQAEAAVAATKGKGNYVLLMGQAGHSVANDITAGVESVLKKYPDIKVVVKKSHESWSGSLAMATVENALALYKNEIQAILANNSGMANGAVQALEEQKLTGKIFVAGADADLAAIKNVYTGKQQLEILKDIGPLAKSAAQIAAKLIRKEKPSFTSMTVSGAYQVPTLATPVFEITKSNMDARIFSSGFHSRQSVIGK